MTIKRRALSILLSLAVIFTFMPFVSTQAYAASSKKVQLVTKAKSDEGNTTYSYNKKGLVSKAVTKYSSKGEGYDYSTVETTTFKYNKKNRIASETKKTVVTETSYGTSKTTGKNNGVKKGTVKTTTTDKTKYTYKKGKAVKAVTKTTVVKSGSMTTNEKGRSLTDVDYYDDEQLADGRIIAGYNFYNRDGSINEKNTSANAYYYEGPVESATYDGTTTKVYRPNADGTYTVITTKNESNANFVRDRVVTYYKNGGAPGTADDYDYSVTEKVNVTLNNKTDEYEDEPATSTSTEECTYTKKASTTTKYSYKKNNVKKAVSTTVRTFDPDSEESETYVTGPSTKSSTTYYSDGSAVAYNSTDNIVNKNSYSETVKNTTTYSYKKGKVAKKVVSDAGVPTYTNVYTRGLENSSSESVHSNGTKDSYKWTESGPDCEYETTTTVAGGTKTVTTRRNEYTTVFEHNGVPSTWKGGKNETTTKTDSVKATPSKATTKYSYDKKGNVKSSKETGKKSEEKILVNETFGNALVEFGADGETKPATMVDSTSYKITDKFSNTVKAGTKRLKVALKFRTKKSGRYTHSGYDLGRRKFTLKAKKLSSKNAKAAELQQWIIQNGGLNGVVGL